MASSKSTLINGFLVALAMYNRIALRGLHPLQYLTGGAGPSLFAGGLGREAKLCMDYPDSVPLSVGEGSLQAGPKHRGMRAWGSLSCWPHAQPT